MNATFTKLRDGNWGLRVTGGTPAPGQTINVSKKDGAVVRKTIGKVLWKGPDACLCTVEDDRPSNPGTSGRRSGGSSGCCRECRGALVSAPHHRAMGGLCGFCAFDEYDC